MTEIYFSTDIEANGPLPIENSMLSLGSAAFHPDGRLLDTFYANLKTLPLAGENHATMEFWKKNPEAYAQTRTDQREPKEAMESYVRWIDALCRKHSALPVFVAYPAGFDFLFVYTYLLKFAGQSPFSFSALDVKTYAMAMLDKPYRQSTKKNMPKRWFGKNKHTHNALEDAIEQGHLFINMLHENIGFDKALNETKKQAALIRALDNMPPKMTI